MECIDCGNPNAMKAHEGVEPLCSACYNISKRKGFPGGIRSVLTPRQEYKKAAMQGLLAGAYSPDKDGLCWDAPEDREGIVQWAANLADAMLAEDAEDERGEPQP